MCLKPTAGNTKKNPSHQYVTSKLSLVLGSITQMLSSEFMNSFSEHPLCLSGRQRRKKGDAGKEGNKALNSSSKEEDLPFHRFLLRLAINTSLFLPVIVPDTTKLFLPQCSRHTEMKKDSCRDTAGPWWAFCQTKMLTTQEAYHCQVVWQLISTGLSTIAIRETVLPTVSRDWTPRMVQKFIHTSRVKGQKCSH